jgi:hypothetical protein
MTVVMMMVMAPAKAQALRGRAPQWVPVRHDHDHLFMSMRSEGACDHSKPSKTV